MAEVLDLFYEELLKAIDPNGTHREIDTIELSDDSDDSVLRRTADDDSVEVVSSTGENPYSLEITVNGDDSDVSLPVTFAGSTLFAEDSDGEEVTPLENFNEVPMEDSDDQLVVQHDAEIPQIE